MFQHIFALYTSLTDLAKVFLYSYNVGFKTSYQQGPSKPDYYGDLMCKVRKIFGTCKP